MTDSAQRVWAGPLQHPSGAGSPVHVIRHSDIIKRVAFVLWVTADTLFNDAVSTEQIIQQRMTGEDDREW
jgi:hypothetical protein